MRVQQQEERSRRLRRDASGSSNLDEDTKVGGSWLGAGESTPASPLYSRGFRLSSAADSSPDAPQGDSNRPEAIRSRVKEGAKKVEKIQRIGLLRGSSYLDPNRPSDKEELTTVIGIQDDELYRKYLPRPVSALRSVIISVLRKEGPYQARHQAWIRKPWLDRYFVNTSLLGTHSFFLVFLPMAYWLGNSKFARGLVNVLAFGVYLSSALKDLFCIPRPYSPPVTRLTVGTHHLEYGFPSTHSTNSVSIALYLYLWVTAFREVPLVTDQYGLTGVLNSLLWEVGLLFYAGSVVYGRIYAGMHSLTDCIVGSALGASISWVQWSYFDEMEYILQLDSWLVPLTIVPMGLLMVSVHPQPMEDCPCFEDAIAFVAVAMGTTVGKWFGVKFGLQLAQDDPLKPLGAAERLALDAQRLLPSTSSAGKLVAGILDSIRGPVQAFFHGSDGARIGHLGVRALRSTTIVVVGVFSIVLLRVVVKTACKLALPPIFRFVSGSVGFSLPRRHYTPASDYKRIPLADLTAVPSVIDLPSSIIVTDEHGSSAEIGSSAEAAGGSSSLDRGGKENNLRSRSGLQPSGSQSSRPNPTASLFNASPVGSPVPSRTPSPDPLAFRARPGAKLAAGRNERPSERVKFDVGGGDEDDSGSDLPIPLTQSQAHPDFVAPDEQAARYLASKVEGTTPDKIEDNVKHYDADVLTKVIVYSSIGFVAGCILPYFFERVGLSS